MSVTSIRTLASALIARANFSRRAGITFGGRRDIYAAMGYLKEIKPEDFRSRYERNGIAARVVEAEPKATWRGGIELIEDEDPETLTDFEDSWDELNKRLKIWTVFSRADILAGLGRFSVVFIGCPGKPEEEVSPTLKPEDIFYLSTFGEEDVQVAEVEDNIEDPRYGLPRAYNFSRMSQVAATSGRKVHYSRVLHVAEGLLDDRVYGMSRLNRVWNDLDNLDKVAGAGAEAFWLRAHQGYQFNVDPNIEIEAPDLQKLKDEAEEFANGYRRTLGTRGVETQVFGSDVANFSNPVDGILTLIAGATGIPKRILMGSERGELASTQDRENWEQKISDRRVDFAEAMIVRPFVDWLIEHKALPEPAEYEVRWPEIESLTEPEAATVGTAWANYNKLSGDTVVTAAEIRDRILRLPPLTPEQIAEEEQRKQDAVLRQQQMMGGGLGNPNDPNAPPDPAANPDRAPKPGEPGGPPAPPEDKKGAAQKKKPFPFGGPKA